jgi:hypothetical protein
MALGGQAVAHIEEGRLGVSGRDERLGVPGTRLKGQANIREDLRPAG